MEKKSENTQQLLEIKEYTEFVEKLASTSENEVFFNSGPVHAAIVMSRIFKYSEKNVKIFCGGFNGEVSNNDEYLKYLDEFLSKPETSITAIVENDLSKSEDSKIFAVLKNYPKKVNLYHTTRRVWYESESNDTRKFVHFAIGDDKMLRLETGIDEYIAQVNFGDITDTKEWVDLFDQLLKTNPQKIELLN